MTLYNVEKCESTEKLVDPPSRRVCCKLRGKGAGVN
jgi:hypothetical protein